MLKKYSGKLYCFSPPVMLATFLIEICLAFYVLWRYKLNPVSRLAVLTLVVLATFQLAEYMECGGLDWLNIEWARFGYVLITLLPAMGIHMLAKIADKKAPWLITAVYATCAAFVAYYLFGTGVINGQSCRPNYAVFYINGTILQLYTAYYYGWLMVATYLAWHWGMQKPAIRKTLHAMMLGYLAFLVPTTTFNIIDPTTIVGVPSIMCGFAVILAFIIVFAVLPKTSEKRQKLPFKSSLPKK